MAAILDKLDKFSAAKTAEQLIFNDNEALRQRLSVLQQAYREDQDSLGPTFWLMVVGGLLTLIAAAAVGAARRRKRCASSRSARRRKPRP